MADTRRPRFSPGPLCCLGVGPGPPGGGNFSDHCPSTSDSTGLAALGGPALLFPRITPHWSYRSDRPSSPHPNHGATNPAIRGQRLWAEVSRANCTFWERGGALCWPGSAGSARHRSREKPGPGRRGAGLRAHRRRGCVLGVTIPCGTGTEELSVGPSHCRGVDRALSRCALPE